MDVKIYKSMSDDDIRKAILEVSGDDEPKVPATPRKPRVVKLNVELKEAGLWRKGCQFLSSDEKTKLLNAKSKKMQNVIYKIVERKFQKVVKQSVENLRKARTVKK